MTASSWGPKYAPQFSDADAPDVAVNATEVAQYAAKVGNRRVGTTAERLAAEGLDTWEGLVWGDTTDGIDYKFIGGAWVLLSSGSFFVQPVVGSGWNTPAVNLLYQRGGWATYSFNASRSTALAAGGTVCTIPAGYRGSINSWGQGWGLAGAPSNLQVAMTPGTNTVIVNQAMSAGQSIALTLVWIVSS